MLLLAWDVALYMIGGASTTADAYALTDAASTLILLGCRTAVHVWVWPVAAQRLIAWLVIGMWTAQILLYLFVVPSYFAMSKSELASSFTYDLIGVPCWTFVLITLAFTRVQALVLFLPWAIVSLYQTCEHWSTPVLPSLGSNAELGLFVSLVYVGSAALFVWVDALARAHHLQLREVHLREKEREQEEGRIKNFDDPPPEPPSAESQVRVHPAI